MRTSLKRDTIINGRYVIDTMSPTQQSGYITYLCTDKQTNSRVILKEFFPDYASRTQDGLLQYLENQEKDMNAFNEAHQLARKFGTMPTVVAVYDIFTDNNTLYAVCEYVNGRTVDKLWAKGSAFTFSSIQRVIINLLKTNEALGRFGMYHVDYSPENIIITPNGYVKLKVFKPINGVDAEACAIESVMSLAYYMMSGKNLVKGKKSGNARVTGNLKRLEKYVKHVYYTENIQVTTAQVLNDAMKNFDVKLSTNFPKKQKIVSSKAPKNKKTSQKSGSKSTKIAVIAVCALFLLLFAFWGISTANKSADKMDTSLTSIKYSIGAGGEFKDLEYTKKSVFDFNNDTYTCATLDKEVIGNSKMLYLDVEAKSDCTLVVKHNDKDIPINKDGIYEIPIDDSGKITVVSQRTVLMGTIKRSSTYTVEYTRKTFVKLSSIEYQVNSDAFVEMPGFSPDITSYAIKVENNTNLVTFKLAAEGKNISYVLNVPANNVKAAPNYQVSITPAETETTVKAEIVVSDTTGAKEPRTYTVDIVVAAKEAPKQVDEAEDAKKKAEDAKKKAEDAKKKAADDKAAAEKAADDKAAADKAAADKAAADKAAAEEAAKKAAEEAKAQAIQKRKDSGFEMMEDGKLRKKHPDGKVEIYSPDTNTTAIYN